MKSLPVAIISKKMSVELFSLGLVNAREEH